MSAPETIGPGEFLDHVAGCDFCAANEVACPHGMVTFKRLCPEGDRLLREYFDDTEGDTSA